MSEPCVLLTAAEPSGDALGAALTAALRRKLDRCVRFVGVGGPLMAAQGVTSPFDISPLSVLGVFDALRAYPLVRRRAREVGEIAAREQPQVAVLIDSWGFNLRVARAIRRATPDVFIFKYVAPQVWATRPGRARTLARAVDHLLTIHAFDAPWFEKAGLETTFVGNPVFGRDVSGADPTRFRATIGADVNDPILVLAPGSRLGEIERLLGPFEDAATRLTAGRPRLRIAILAAEAVAGAVATRTGNWATTVHIVRGEPDRQGAMSAATAALVCSGTVTTELALAGAPMVVAYRLDGFTASIASLLIRTPYITLFNVAAGRAVAPEFVQEACTGARLAAALAPLLDDPERRADQVREQFAALDIMRGDVADPPAAAADAVITRLFG